MKKTVFPLALSALACAAQAATITVDSLDDNLTATTSGTTCTLRGAVDAINNVNDANGCTNSASDGYGTDDTIEFDPSLAGETVGVVVTNGITISKDLIIKGLLDPDGKPAITLDANPGASVPGSNRIFNVTGGTSLSITGVRFIKGYVNNNNSGGAIYTNALSSHTLTLEQCAFDNNRAGYGGAMRVAGTILINHSTFSKNLTYYHGGAIATNTTSNRATISNSTFSYNTAETGNGGAVWAQNGASISNSTFSENSAGNLGGAMLVSNEPMVARHLTLLNNTATATGGQALHVSDFASTLHNSIIIGSNGSDQCAGSTFTGSHNLEGWAADETSTFQGASSATCGTSSPVSGGSAALNTIIESVLADNGGPTQTLELPVDSPAIMAADASTSQMWDFTTGNWIDAALDQRGYGRWPASPTAIMRSIGAYEYDGLGFTPVKLQEGIQDSPYLPTSIGKVDGGTAPYIYFAPMAQLPNGLTLDEDTGVLSGTPTVAETVFFDVTVSDSENRSVTKSLSLTISPRALPGEPGDAASIPALPAPLLPLLAALMGTAAFVRQRRR